MARRRQDSCREIADRTYIAIGKEMIELAAVATEFRAGIEQRAEGFLHRSHAGPDGDAATRARFEGGRRGQMIGMDVGLEDPDQGKPVLGDKSEDAVGLYRRRAP